MKTLDLYIAEALVKNHILINDDMVDLGLPSGNLWATCNLGANKPDEYGNYYMWGSIEDNNNDNCCWENSPFNDGRNLYDSYTSWDITHNVIDDDGNLLPKYDAATIKLGRGWKIPSKKDFEELIDNTVYKRISMNKRQGLLITSKKNNNSIFIPINGMRYKKESVDIGDSGYLWTSTIELLNLAGAHVINVNDELYIGSIGDFGAYRCMGCGIRPIYKG